MGDIAEIVGSFLPPPASAVTGVLSGILNMFGAGGPSTEDIVKEEFAKMKKFTMELFREQNKFIESKFEDQADLIRDQTAKIISRMDQQTKRILSKILDLNGDIKSYIKGFKEFYQKDRITDLQSKAEALHEVLDKHLASVDGMRYESINDATIQLLLSKLDAPVEELFFALIKKMFKPIWLELTRTGIPIRRMSPKRLHSRTSHALCVNRNCMGFFASGQKLPLDR